MLKPIKLGIVLLLVTSKVLAHTPSLVSDPKAAITHHFSKSLPSLSIDKLEPSPIEGLYQVTSGPIVMYVTSNGYYAFSGDVLDLRDGKTNLTQKAREKALLSALDKVGESNMIVYAPPLSVRHLYTITVFSDLECEYCQKLHSQIDKLTQLGIKVRYVGFPRAGRYTSGYDKLVSVWCAADRKAAFTNAMLGKMVSLKGQGHSIDKQFHLGALAGVTDTPTFVIEGKLIPGYIEPSTLVTILKEMTPSRSY